MLEPGMAMFGWESAKLLANTTKTGLEAAIMDCAGTLHLHKYMLIS